MNDDDDDDDDDATATFRSSEESDTPEAYILLSGSNEDQSVNLRYSVVTLCSCFDIKMCLLWAPECSKLDKL